MKTKQFILGIFILGLLGGCSNIGNAPEGQSEEEAKAALQKMSPQEQINMIKASPMPPAEKEKKIRELEAKMGGAPIAPSQGNEPALPGR
jgi:hypothetical protein